MRIKKIVQLLVPLGLMGLSLLMMTGTVSTTGLFELYQQYTSGVIGRTARADHMLTASANIAPTEGHSYPGQLDARLIFGDPEGAETVFEIQYPSDYDRFHDGFGPLWLANWRPDIANNPQVSPVLGNTCLQTINGENLASSVRYRTGYREYIVCRFLDEEQPGAPRVYDISVAKTAVIGVIWANRNHQPIDYPRERCIAEIRIWAIEIAQPDDQFMACVFVVDENPSTVEIFAFELTRDSIVEIGGGQESWPRKGVPTRDAPRLMQYRKMKDWLTNNEAHASAVARAYSDIVNNVDLIVPARVSRFDGVEYRDGIINFTFSAKNTPEMIRIRDGSRYGADGQLYRQLRKTLCGSDERAALLAFQQNRPTYMYDLNRHDGRPLTRFATFPNLPC